MFKGFWSKIFLFLAIFIGIWLLFDLTSRLWAEIFWFREVNYLAVFWQRSLTQLGLLLGGISLSAAFLFGHLILAQRYKFRHPLKVKQKINLSLRLPLLLPIALILSTIVALMLLYYLQVATQFWQPNYSLVLTSETLPEPFTGQSIPQLLQEISGQVWQLGALVVVISCLLIKPTWSVSIIAASLSLIFGLVWSGNWSRVLQYLYQTPFGNSEPLFRHDISFYVFKLPIWELFNFWLGGLFWYALIAVSLIYLLSGNSLAQGKFPGLSQAQLRHLYGLSAGVMVITALRHWLSRYELLYSARGVIYGAGYTDAKVQLPAETVIVLMSMAIACWFIVQFLLCRGDFVPQKSYQQAQSSNDDWKTILRNNLERPTNFNQPKKTPQPLYPVLGVLAVYAIVIVASAVVLPELVQRFRVQPNELALESPYIKRSINLTRNAFALDKIEVKTFDPQGTLTAQDIKNNHLTIDNIRLWDTRPLLQTNRQLQQIRLYYRFPDADIDRYTFEIEETGKQENGEDVISSEPANINERQQVIIAPRELDYGAVPQEAQTWVNRHLIYTHGYGFTLSPVNRIGEGGLPSYYVRDIGTGSDAGVLLTASPEIREGVPIYNPRIYYGEMTNNYVMTDTKVQELDFPSGEENVYNTYDGTGGIALGNYGSRLLFAEYLKDWQMLFTRNFTPQTRLLFRRNIKQRIRAIAPFLRYDHNPYLVTINRQAPARDEQDLAPPNNHLYWIVDAYTTSNHYPYSDPGEHTFNYIRNSVKVVIDAYNGKVEFFVADLEDPIIQTWMKIFPQLFQPLGMMPPTLREHIRYPTDFFEAQAEQLRTYHMRDPQVFYNREDQWQIPQEIYGSESQPVQPYYLIMKLPTEAQEEFILLLPYTPTARNNLIAWMAGRADGEQYGRLLLYQFPKQKLIYGTEQIEALINQDPVISQQISLWDRQGSKAIQGNLLVIPIEESLLYVEPLYLEAEQNSLPTLVRVIVVYNNRIVMAQTLKQAINVIFAPNNTSTPAIIRNVEAQSLGEN